MAVSATEIDDFLFMGMGCRVSVAVFAGSNFITASKLVRTPQVLAELFAAEPLS